MRLALEVTVNKERLNAALDGGTYVDLLTEIADELIEDYGQLTNPDDWWTIDRVSSHAGPKLLRERRG